MPERSWKMLPNSKAGKWSLGLIILMPILLFIGTSLIAPIYNSVPAGSNLLADLVSRPFLTLFMLAGMAAGISSFITGLVTILKKKEKALLVYISTIIGGLVTFFLISLMLFPE